MGSQRVTLTGSSEEIQEYNCKSELKSDQKMATALSPYRIEARLVQNMTEESNIAGERETHLQLSIAPGHQDHLIIRLSLAPRRLQDTQSHMMEEVCTKAPASGLSSSGVNCISRDRGHQVSGGCDNTAVTDTSHVFKTPCFKHRPSEAEAGDLAHFVLRCCAEDAFYSLGPRGKARDIILHWEAGHTRRTVRLEFVCSHRCYPEIEEEWILNLKISLEDPFYLEELATTSISIIPP